MQIVRAPPDVLAPQTRAYSAEHHVPVATHPNPRYISQTIGIVFLNRITCRMRSFEVETNVHAEKSIPHESSSQKNKFGGFPCQKFPSESSSPKCCFY